MLDDKINNLVHKKLVFEHLKDMGMIGSSGRKANAEACRRNAQIKNIQKELDISNKELNKLVQRAIEEKWFE